jgi:hypothetical protein
VQGASQAPLTLKQRPRASGEIDQQRRARRRINRFSPKMAAQSVLRSTISGRPFARALYLNFEKEAETAFGLPPGVHSYALQPIAGEIGSQRTRRWREMDSNSESLSKIVSSRRSHRAK